jgi:hypothetical protein
MTDSFSHGPANAARTKGLTSRQRIRARIQDRAQCADSGNEQSTLAIESPKIQQAPRRAQAKLETPYLPGPKFGAALVPANLDALGETGEASLRLGRPQQKALMVRELFRERCDNPQYPHLGPVHFGAEAVIQP